MIKEKGSTSLFSPPPLLSSWLTSRGFYISANFTSMSAHTGTDAKKKINKDAKIKM